MIFEKDRLAVGKERYSLQNAKHWISTETGSHLLLDGDGNVVGGAGGALKGQKFVKVTRKGKDVEGGGKKEKPETKEKSEGLKTAQEKHADYNNKIKKMAMDNIQKNTEILTGKGIPDNVAKDVAERFIEFSTLYNNYRLSRSTTLEKDRGNLGLEKQKKELIQKNKELSSLQEEYDIDLGDLNVPEIESWMGFDEIRRERNKQNSSPIKVYRVSR